jgi:hypothetical protein
VLTSRLLPSTRIGRADFLGTEISGRLVLMNAIKGNYVKLDDIGTQIWQRLERSMTVAELCEDLQAVYDVDGSVLERDVITFLENMRIQGLLEVVPLSTGP